MKTKFNIVKQLSNKKIVEGIGHCFNNSNNLFSSALALKRNKKYGVATSILTLSIEELMKSLALLNILLSDTDEKEVYKDIFESNDLHGNRLDFALFMNEYFKQFNLQKTISSADDAESPEELSRSIAKKINIHKIIKSVEKEKQTFNNWFDHANANKNAGLYVAYNNKWFTPYRITEKEFLKALKETKLIKKNLSIILSLIISLDESGIENVINFWKQFKSQIATNIGIEKPVQPTINEEKK